MGGRDRHAHEMKTRVLLLSRYDRLGASSRVRSYQFLPHLAEQGIIVHVRPLFGDDYLRTLYAKRTRRARDIFVAYATRLAMLAKGGQYDLIWIEKEVLPWFPWKLEKWLMPRGPRILVDYDDAIFHNYDLNNNALIRTFLADKIDEVMRNSNVVTVGSAYLEERARRAGAVEVFKIPSVVDTESYVAREWPESGPRTIAWIGSPVTVNYLDAVKRPLQQICKKWDAKVRVIGAHWDGIDRRFVTSEKWSEISEARAIQECVVGIMPLPDEPWERGKCGYKLVQYMAASRPCVASAVGENGVIVDDGVTGFLADNESAWFDALDILVGQPRRAREMGLAARRRAVERYSLESASTLLVAAIRAALRGSKCVA